MPYHYYLRAYLFLLMVLLGILGLILLGSKPDYTLLRAKRKVVKRFILSDYCLSTESRHTRHLSMPELIAPFQDFPGYHDHFPSSSFTSPINIPERD